MIIEIHVSNAVAISRQENRITITRKNISREAGICGDLCIAGIDEKVTICEHCGGEVREIRVEKSPSAFESSTFINL